METINDRMEMLVNELFNGNKAAFAKAIAVEPSTMSSYLGNKRRSKPSVDMVAKMVIALNVDARWLLTGERPTNDNDNDADATTGGVAIAGNATAHHFTTNACTDTAALQEQIKLLKQIIDEKERLISILLNKQ